MSIGVAETLEAAAAQASLLLTALGWTWRDDLTPPDPEKVLALLTDLLANVQEAAWEGAESRSGRLTVRAERMDADDEAADAAIFLQIARLPGVVTLNEHLPTEEEA